MSTPCVSPWGWTPDPCLRGQADLQLAEAPPGTTSQQVPGEPLQTGLRTAGLLPACVVWMEERRQQLLIITFYFSYDISRETSFSPHPLSSSPLHTLATDGVPFVTNFSYQVIQFLSVCRQLSFVPHGLTGPHCGVINRLLWSQCFLKLLDMQKKDCSWN